jgi:hypothetical protein
MLFPPGAMGNPPRQMENPPTPVGNVSVRMAAMLTRSGGMRTWLAAVPASQMWRSHMVPSRDFSRERRRSESNRRMEVLQTSALPLGYGAGKDP